jgi:hypothetical protein
VVGNFNSIRIPEERRSEGSADSSRYSRDMMEFDLFLRELDLIDMPIVGRRFTWFHLNGISASKLDRVLLSSGWLKVWGNPIVWVLPRDLSYHIPLILRYSEADWDPKPFRFNNFWLELKSFKDLVVKVWDSQTLTGWMGFVLKERLKEIKGEIKRWNAETFWNSEARKNDLVEKILAIDLMSESNGITEDKVRLRKLLFEELWNLLKNIDVVIFQRSRVKWFKDGDSNTRSSMHVLMQERDLILSPL